MFLNISFSVIIISFTIYSYTSQNDPFVVMISIIKGLKIIIKKAESHERIMNHQQISVIESTKLTNNSPENE